MSLLPTPRRMLPGPAVRARYGLKSRKALSGWVKRKILPPPDINRNGRNYWWEDTLEEHDRQAVIETAAKRLAKGRNSEGRSGG